MLSWDSMLTYSPIFPYLFQSYSLHFRPEGFIFHYSGHPDTSSLQFASFIFQIFRRISVIWTVFGVSTAFPVFRLSLLSEDCSDLLFRLPGRLCSVSFGVLVDPLAIIFQLNGSSIFLSTWHWVWFGIAASPFFLSFREDKVFRISADCRFFLCRINFNLHFWLQTLWFQFFASFFTRRIHFLLFCLHRIFWSRGMVHKINYGELILLRVSASPLFFLVKDFFLNRIAAVSPFVLLRRAWLPVFLCIESFCFHLRVCFLLPADFSTSFQFFALCPLYRSSGSTLLFYLRRNSVFCSFFFYSEE